MKIILQGLECFALMPADVAEVDQVTQRVDLLQTASWVISDPLPLHMTVQFPVLSECVSEVSMLFDCSVQTESLAHHDEDLRHKKATTLKMTTWQYKCLAYQESCGCSRHEYAFLFQPGIVYHSSMIHSIW